MILYLPALFAGGGIFLADNCYDCPDRNEACQRQYILVIHADTTAGYYFANGGGVIGSVDAIVGYT